MDGPQSGTRNRLRSHFEHQQAQNPQKRRQSDIVRDYGTDIISLIKDDGATLPEVVSAVKALGEPVLEHGFKAELLKQIGTVKDIRAGRAVPFSQSPTPKDLALPPSPIACATSLSTGQPDPADDLADDENLFAARRPRG